MLCLCMLARNFFGFVKGVKERMRDRASCWLQEQKKCEWISYSHASIGTVVSTCLLYHDADTDCSSKDGLDYSSTEPEPNPKPTSL